MSDELKPCPFCGITARTIYVHAENCFMRQFARALPDKKYNLTDLWNARPIEDALRARVVELEARLDGADVDNVTAIAKNLNEMRLMEENAKLRAALKAANEDAERLCKLVTGAVFSSRLGYVDTAEGAAAYRLHRARVNGKLEGGESVMDSPDKEAKG